MKPLGLKLETELFKSGCLVVVGCDEVGRGALAGPIVAGAVGISAQWIVNSEQQMKNKEYEWVRKVRDSKLLKPSDREELAIHIKQNCLAWSVAVVSPKVIDKINIHQANLLALHRAVAKLHKHLGFDLVEKRFSTSSNNKAKTHTLIDGRFTIPMWNGSQGAVIDGDAKVFSIAAASIIAKVYRDQLMMKQDKKFLGYGFAKHKGYGTQVHMSAIRKMGISSIHRKTFC